MVKTFSTSFLASMISNEEKILWWAKPDKKCFVLEAIFNPLLPFAFLWGMFDGFFIFGMTNAGSNAPKEMLSFMIPFFLIHLMPVWIYIGGVLSSFLRHKHTEYIITDKAVYVSGGALSCSYKSKTYDKITEINVHRGLFDQMLSVGDVILADTNDIHYVRKRGYVPFKIEISDIPDYHNVYNMIKGLIEDNKKPLDIEYQDQFSQQNTDKYNDRQIDF